MCTWSHRCLAEDRGHTPTSLFYTRDLVGVRYVGVVTSTLRQLWLIRCGSQAKASFEMVSMETIPCVDAVSLFHLSMMLVLEESGRSLAVYSGPTKVGPVTCISCDV